MKNSDIMEVRELPQLWVQNGFGGLNEKDSVF